MTVVEAVGWLAAAALLVAYTLLTTGRVAQSSRTFVGLNAFGAAGLIVNGMVHAAWPSVSLNVLWLLIGIAGFVLPARRSSRATGRAGQ